MDAELWTVVLVHVIALAGLCVRLRWRLHRERVRARMLVDLAAALSAGGAFEDGRTRLSVAPVRKRSGDDG
jgi:hypothetical protein